MPWPPKKLALRASSPFIPPRSTSSRLPFHRHRDIEQARRVVAAFERLNAPGGSTSLDGKVVDVPVVKRAKALLEIAESIRHRQPSSVRRSMSLFTLVRDGIGLLLRRPQMLAVGSQAPDFAATAHDGSSVCPGDFRGKRLSVWFYPKADTGG